MTATTNAKQVLLNRAHFADAVSSEAAETIAAAMRTSPVIDFEKATAIGRELSAHLGTEPRMDDFGMADAVQFVLRRARAVEDGREG